MTTAIIKHELTVPAASGWVVLQVAGPGCRGLIRDVRAMLATESAPNVTSARICIGRSDLTFAGLVHGDDPNPLDLRFDGTLTPVPASDSAELDLNEWERDIVVQDGFAVGVDFTVGSANGGKFTVQVDCSSEG